jgi:hypothetical protein
MQTNPLPVRLVYIILVITLFGIGLLSFTSFPANIGLFGVNNKSGSNLAYGHFFGDNKTIDGFKVVFLPFPLAPIAGENATLNFSVLDEENNNINNIFSALIIKEKEPNQIVDQIPYTQYEFSDFSIPYRFRNNTSYVVTLETRVMGDPKYQAEPIVASFDLSVGDPTYIAYRNLIQYVVASAALLALVVCLVILYRRKRQRSVD